MRLSRSALVALSSAIAVVGLLALRLGLEPAEAARVAAYRRPLLWQVEAPERIFVLGTIHVPDARVLRVPRVVEEALEASDVVLTELSESDLDPASLRDRTFLPRGTELKDVVPADLAARVDRFFAARGAGPEYRRMKPWVLAQAIPLALAPPSLRLPGAKPLDALLPSRAEAAGKATGGLETVEEQLGLFESLSEDEQAEMLAQALDAADRAEDEGTSSLDELLDAYLLGEEGLLLASVERETATARPWIRKFYRRAIEDRNHRMVERLLARVAAEPGRTWFVAVGAAHLPGPEGIVALLGARGYAARRMELADAVAVPAGR